MTRPNVTLSR